MTSVDYHYQKASPISFLFKVLFPCENSRTIALQKCGHNILVVVVYIGTS